MEDMQSNDHSSKSVKFKNHKFNLMKHITTTLLILLLLFGVFVKPNLPVPHIKAEPYITPSGCIVKRYNVIFQENISKNCLSDKYELPLLYFFFHNLSNIGNRGRFYRIGNDVYKVRCSSMDDICSVQAVTYNVYY